ncbi:hypothetical protein ACOMCU_02250 [Lysinibacillus sp. UGB7]|uniref:hypothetical protein n=1 Tax=Lysinibacillus sp. UGB7 TaxID=3411039 RepID=UPI003B7BA66A
MKKIKNRDGNVSIMTVLLISALLPLFLFIIFDISTFQYVKIDTDDALSRSGHIAALSINEDLIKYGELELDENQVKAIGSKVLDTNLTDIAGKFKEQEFEINVSNQLNPHTVMLNDQSNVSVENPYVRIRGTYRVDGIIGEKFFGKSVDEIYQVSFIKNEKAPIINAAESAMMWTNIVNPYRGYENISYPISMHSEDVELLGGTINEFSITFNNLLGAILQVSVNGEKIQDLSYMGDGSENGANFSLELPTEKQLGNVTLKGTVVVENSEFPTNSDVAALEINIPEFSIGYIEADIKEKIKVEHHMLHLIK